MIIAYWRIDTLKSRAIHIKYIPGRTGVNAICIPSEKSTINIVSLKNSQFFGILDLNRHKISSILRNAEGIYVFRLRLYKAYELKRFITWSTIKWIKICVAHIICAFIAVLKRIWFLIDKTRQRVRQSGNVFVFLQKQWFVLYIALNFLLVCYFLISRFLKWSNIDFEF